MCSLKSSSDEKNIIRAKNFMFFFNFDQSLYFAEISAVTFNAFKIAQTLIYHENSHNSEIFFYFRKFLLFPYFPYIKT